MHPAYSVILFTTASGAGYGMVFIAAVLTLLRPVWFSSSSLLVILLLALVLITLGLLSSTFHLGHPERAWRAFREWRSSWLSREAIAAVLSYLPLMLWIVLLTFNDSIARPVELLLALASALGALATVFCTAMIYASLRTVRQWHREDVPLNYLALAGCSGALLVLLVLSFAAEQALVLRISLAMILAMGSWIKGDYWRDIDKEKGLYTIGEAIGVGADVKVRQLESPHTQPNFVMREMGYAVARRHVEKLRRICFVLLFVVPGLLVLLSIAIWPAALMLLASVSMMLGLLIERWLFFAEAEHVSQLYYGVARA